MLRNKEPELAEKIDTHSGVLTSVFTASISFLAPGMLLFSKITDRPDAGLYLWRIPSVQARITAKALLDS